MQIPSNMFMSNQKIRPSLYLSFCMMAWALVSGMPNPGNHPMPPEKEIIN